MKINWRGGGVRGLINFLPVKNGGLLERGGGLVERGSLIENLRYIRGDLSYCRQLNLVQYL